MRPCTRRSCNNWTCRNERLAWPGGAYRLGLSLLDRQLVHGVALAQLLDHVQAVHHIAEEVVAGGQLAMAVGVADEELAAVGVGARVGHRHGTLSIAPLHGFVLELVARTSAAGAGGVAALDDEVGDVAVEGEAVVVPL